MTTNKQVWLVIVATALASWVAANDELAFLNTDGLSQLVVETIATARTKAEAADPVTEPAAASSAWGRLGMLLQAQGFDELAVNAYTRALEIQPQSAWLYLRSVTHGELGNLDQAITGFERLIQDQAGVPTIWYRLGRALLTRGDVALAERALENALVLDDSSPAVLAAMSEVLIANGELQKAIPLLEKAMAIDPQAGQIAYQLARVHRKLGNRATFRDLLAKRNDIAPAVDDPLMVEVARFSMNPGFFVAAAQRAWQRGLQEDALVAYQTAIEMAPDNVTYRLDHADMLLTMNRNLKANTELAKFELLASHSARYWYLLAKSVRRYSSVDEALDYVRQSLRLNESLSARQLHGELSMKAGRYGDAAKDFMILRHQDEDNVYYRYWMGLAFFRWNRCKEALTYIHETVKMESSWGQAHIALSRLECVCGSQEQGLSRANELLQVNESEDNRISVLFAKVSAGVREKVRRELRRLLPHLDARMLLDHYRKRTAPEMIFHEDSQQWIPSNVQSFDPVQEN